jgi:transposase
MDPNREKTSKAKGGPKPGGQPGHSGTTLLPVEKPDQVEKILINRRKLPPGKWKAAGYEKRQVIELVVKRVVIEYQAEILINERGDRITAEFPEGVTQKAQYGASVKSHAVYMSVKQMVPCERVSDHFSSQMNIPLSTGSVCNFKEQAYELLGWFDQWVNQQLIHERVLHLDETGINIGGKRVWLHNASSGRYTRLYPHEKRGKEAMEEMGILRETGAVLIHDHWKPYYSYEEKVHGLCNAHHIRELTLAKEEGESWAQPMIDFLVALNTQVEKEGGVLEGEGQEKARITYRKLLEQGEKECPRAPEKPPGKRGRTAQTKSRNLLERLRDYEEDVLRFMSEKEVPFTNNQAERDLRMTKVQQKISGCFRSWDGAKVFYRIRSYVSTCEKNGVSSAEALDLLFQGKIPDFIVQTR